MRLRAQAIAGPKATSPAAAVQRMLALQAQDFEAACWAVGTRTEGATRDDVFAALDSGAIVRSWPMRGTLHFVPPADLRWMLGVTTERMVAGLALRHRRLELEDEHFATARELVCAALSGGRRISRAELMALWERNGIATGGQRGYHLIYYLAQTGLLCWGPLENGRQTLVLLDEWAPQARALEHDEALAEFFLRYLAGHGPATVKDFVWWTKGTMAGAKIAIAVLGDRIESVEYDGTPYWVAAESVEAAGAAATHRPSTQDADAARLLPAFDEYLLGYQDRSPVLDAENASVVVPGGNGVFAPIVVARGRIVGTWRRRAGTGRVTVDAVPLAAFTSTQRAQLRRSAATYGRFLGTSGVLAETVAAG